MLGAVINEWVRTGAANWDAVGAGTAGLVGLLQVLVMRRQAQISEAQTRILRVQVSQSQTGLSIQADAENHAKGSNIIVEDTLRTNQEIERAHITLQNKRVIVRGEPDGRGGEDTSLRAIRIAIEIEISNVGRTAGDYIGGFVCYSVGDNPHITIDGLNQLTPAFLLPDQVVDFWLDVTPGPELIRQVMLGKTRLWLIAETDYVDRFQRPHTSGYGRLFDPHQRKFLFSTEVAEFNYDRPMHPDKVRHYGRHQPTS